MKMRYTRNNRSLSIRASLLGGAVLLIVLSLLVLRFLFPNVFFSLAFPVWTLGTSLQSQFEGVKDEELVARNTELVNENLVLKARLRDVGADEAIPTEDGILAGVVARPPLSPYDTLIFSKGREAGIAAGALVFALGIPIGTVEESGDGFSRALLYSSPGRITEGWVGEGRAPLSLIGRGAGTYVATASRGTEILEGDIVYLPGPGAFPAGMVRRIQEDAASPSLVVYVEPLVNIFTLTYVRLLSPTP